MKQRRFNSTANYQRKRKQNNKFNVIKLSGLLNRDIAKMLPVAIQIVPAKRKKGGNPKAARASNLASSPTSSVTKAGLYLLKRYRHFVKSLYI